MAMNDVLSLLGNAILKDVDGAGLEAMVDRAPGLSEAEREDLRRIPHERLRAYQADFYGFETGMMKWGFSCTWDCMEQLGFGQLDRCGISPARTFMFQFKNSHPSESHSIRETAQHFVDFLRNDCQSITHAHPWILDLAEAERLEIVSLYDEDSNVGAALDNQGRHELFGSSVDELFQRELVRADGAAGQIFGCDVPSIKTDVNLARRRGLPIAFSNPAFRSNLCPMIIARNPETLQPQWYITSAAEVAVLGTLHRNRPVTVEALADRYCRIIEPQSALDGSEEALLRRFCHFLDRWLLHRYLFLVA